MAQFTLPDWARSTGRAVDLRSSPYWSPQEAGDGIGTLGNGDGSGYYSPLNQWAGQQIGSGDGQYGTAPDMQGLLAMLQGSGQQVYEAGQGSELMRWLQDAQGNVTAAPESFNLQDDNFGLAALLAAGVVTGGAAGAFSGTGGGLSAIAPSTAQASGALTATGLQSTAPLITSAIPSVGGAVGLTAGEIAAATAAGGGALGGGAGAFGGGGFPGAFGSTAPAAGASGFAIPSFAAPADGGLESGALLKSGIGLAGNLAGGYLQGQAQQNAAGIQADAATAGQQTMRDIYAQIQQQLAPYTQAGPGALQGQQNLIGLGGPQAQQQAIQGLQSSPEFSALTKQGEDAILSNASATGGLRGGNVQSALAQFRPQVLAQLINQQYSRLGGLTSLGQNSAAGVGNAALTTGGSIAGLQQQGGAAAAGGALAQGRTNAGYFNSIVEALGLYSGLTGG